MHPPPHGLHKVAMPINKLHELSNGLWRCLRGIGECNLLHNLAMENVNCVSTGDNRDEKGHLMRLTLPLETVSSFPPFYMPVIPRECGTMKSAGSKPCKCIYLCMM